MRVRLLVLIAVLTACAWAQQPVVPGVVLGSLTPITSSNGTLNATFLVVANTGTPTVLVQLDQTTTITAGAIRFQISYDGTNFVNTSTDAVTDPTSTSNATISMPYSLQASTNKAFMVNMKGAQALQILVSTAMTGTGSVTPYYSLFPIQASTIFNALTSIGGTAVSTATSGVQKVGVVGNAAGAFDAAGDRVTAPANNVIVGGHFTHFTNGQMTSGQSSALQLNQLQELRVMPGGDLIQMVSAGAATNLLTSSTYDLSSAFGTATISYSGITGSPSNCNLREIIADNSSAGTTFNAWTSSTLTVGTTQSFAVNPSGQGGSINVGSAWGVSFQFSCGAYPSGGTATIEFVPAQATNVLPALANAAAPSWTEGDQVLESVDLKGNQRISINDASNGPTAVKPPIATTLTSSVPTFTTAGATNNDKALVTTLSANSGVPAIIQKTSGTGSGSQASLATSNFGASVTAGNSLVVLVGVGNNGTVKISDTLGNPFTQDVCVANSTTFQSCIFHATNVKGGTDAVTVTPSASVSLAIEAYEVSGIIGYGGGGDPTNNSTANQQNSSDVLASASGTSTAPASGSTTNTYPNEIAFTALAIGTANQTPSAFQPWSKDQDIVVGGSPSGLFGFHAFSQPLGNPGATVSFTGTITSEPWAVAMAAFVPVQQASSGTTSLVTNASTGGSALRCIFVSAASTNATNCKANPGNIYGFRFVNTTSTIYYLRMYNLAAAPTCSSSTGFVETIPIPAGSSGGGLVSIEPFGEAYSTGISFCFTAGSSSTDNTNAATGVFGTILYR